MATILIIDDDSAARETSSMLLRLEGLEAVTAADGATGIALASSRAFDLVLVDLHLPDISGAEVARQLKAGGMCCPVLVVTAFPELDSCFDSAKAGADAYVEGPLFNDDLLALVWHWLPANRTETPNLGAERQGAQPRPASYLTETQLDPRIAVVIRVLDNDLRAPIAQIANRVNLSLSRLRHLFVMETGQRLSQYRQNRRLQHAAALLRGTRRRISEIAQEVGLESASFDKAFRARFGHTPSEYRQRYGRKSPGRSSDDIAVLDKQ